MLVRRSVVQTLVGSLLGFAVAAACGEDDSSGAEGESAGQSCDAAEQCYEDADRDAIAGEVLCLDRVEGGYCTHECVTDADCCAAEGECDGRPQVCAPFESTGMMMCFLSCESADVEGDADEYCSTYAHAEFGCRSTGGGSDNRKVCA